MIPIRSIFIRLVVLALSVFFVSAGEGPEHKQSANVLLREAFRASLHGDDERAVQFYQQYFESNGEVSGYALSEYARSLARLKKFEQALQVSSQAMEVLPHSAEPLTLHSEILRNLGRKKEAVQILEEGLGRFPDNGRIEFYLAETLYNMQRINEAIIHYRQLLFHLNSAGPEAPVYRSISLWRLANIFLIQDNPRRAQPFLIKYLKYNPERLYARFVLGFHVYFKNGNYDQAMEQFRIILAAGDKTAREQDVDLYAVYSAAGRIRYLQDSVEAVYLLKKALDEKPGDLLNRGLILQALEQNQRALDVLLKYTESDPDDLFARYAILKILSRISNANEKQKEMFIQQLVENAVIANRKGQTELGIDLTTKALELNQAGIESQVQRSSMYELLASHYSSISQYERSALYMHLALLEAKKEGRTSNETVHTNLQLRLAQYYALSGRNNGQDALEVIDRVARDHSNPPAILHYLRGMIYLNRDELDHASAQLSRAIEIDPDHETYYYYRAVSFHRLDQFEKAESDLKKAIQLNPEWSNALNYLGYLYAEKSVHLQEAEQMIQKAVQSAPTNAAYQDSLGWLYYKKKEYEKARYHLNLASLLSEEQKTRDPDIYEHLGDVYKELKLPSKAIEIYRRAVFLAEKKLQNRDEAGFLNEYEKGRLKAVLKRVGKKIEEITKRDVSS